MTPQIAKRAYELYEERGRQSDPAVQDWEQAQKEIRKDEAKVEPKPETKAEPKSKAEVKPDAKDKPKPEVKIEPKPEAQRKFEAVRPERLKAKTPSDVSPQLVKRVHRTLRGVRARGRSSSSGDWEKAEQENRKDEPHK